MSRSLRKQKNKEICKRAKPFSKYCICSSFFTQLFINVIMNWILFISWTLICFRCKFCDPQDQPFCCKDSLGPTGELQPWQPGLQEGLGPCQRLCGGKAHNPEIYITVCVELQSGTAFGFAHSTNGACFPRSFKAIICDQREAFYDYLPKEILR